MKKKKKESWYKTVKLDTKMVNVLQGNNLWVSLQYQTEII